jgi:hypothetical protein
MNTHSQIWDLNIDREDKFILLAYAQHARPDGSDIYPSVNRIAKMTGYTPRRVRTLTHHLVKLGLLIPDGLGPQATNRFRLHDTTEIISALKLLQPPEKKRALPPEIISPELKNFNLSTEEEEEVKISKSKISPELEQDLTEAHIYKRCWSIVEQHLANSWGEEDIRAVLTWCTATRDTKPKAAQAFVTRLKEGSKAPREYYRTFWIQEFADVPDPDPAPVQHPVQSQDKGWLALQRFMETEIPKTIYRKWLHELSFLETSGGVFRLGVPDQVTKDYLDARVRKTLEQFLAGVYADAISIEFTVLGTAA